MAIYNHLQGKGAGEIGGTPCEATPPAMLSTGGCALPKTTACNGGATKTPVDEGAGAFLFTEGTTPMDTGEGAGLTCF